jgi:hypothetical protein
MRGVEHCSAVSGTIGVVEERVGTCTAIGPLMVEHKVPHGRERVVMLLSMHLSVLRYGWQVWTAGKSRAHCRNTGI